MNQLMEPIYYDDSFDQYIHKKFLRHSSTSNCTQNYTKVHKYDNPKYSLLMIAIELYPEQYKHLIPYYKIITGCDLPNA